MFNVLSFAVEFAERKCLEDGIWESPPGEIAVTASSLINGSFLDRQGWTNYNNCFLPEIRDLLDKLDSGSAEVNIYNIT